MTANQIENVTLTLSAADQFTGNQDDVAQDSSGMAGIYITGAFSFSLSGTFVATIHVQRSVDDGVSWQDVESYEAATLKNGTENEGALYRGGSKAGNYTSGSPKIRFGK